MNPPENQSDCNSETRYFDPEMADSSEQQFAVSLEEDIRPAQFVVECSHEPAKLGDRLTEAGPSPEMSQDSPAENAASMEKSESENATSGDSPEPDWRDLVSAKVNSYKSRRPRKERYPSLQLKFDANHRRQTSEVQEFGFASTCDEPEQPASGRSQPGAPVMLEAAARVLEFPRSLASFASRDELAGPVMDRPRIVEAPELLPPPPALGGILIETAREPEPERRPGFDMPLQSAPPERRVLAGAFDGLVVGAAVAIFGYIAWRIIGAAIPWRTQLAVVAGLLAVFWPAYQYAFLVCCGKTPGLRIARLRLQRFDGGFASRGLRRWRVIASLLSAASLGLGYLWCFLDEDQLSWHDRITRTHLAPAD
jgi:uncharacterized RDD family membrane protein YckC